MNINPYNNLPLLPINIENIMIPKMYKKVIKEKLKK